MGLVKMALADAVITFVWVSCASTMGIFTSLISSALEMRGPASILLITTLLIFLLVFVFNLIGEAMGGASFNPTGTASFYAAGVGNDNLISMAFRLPAQAAGAVGGTIAITELIPVQYRHMLGGPYLKVDLHTGAIAEGVLTFIISFIVLFIILRGPNSVLLKTWLLAISTVALIVAGSDYTGPSMNPANAFGWAYVNNRHNTWEQLYVYWVCPFVGAVLAAWTFRFIFPPVKQKKA
ncbi:hypothetical protein MRB53_032134 [Persea americana]|uniref:Uncharacterized protein n=1 Tax=Persea americana TaxID=3435 RepID=A0ACC2KRF4_PERAE|nr:hypothetical protein MRB53_032134 [Persea americana]|eukprot:TRINITY_DN6285_c0_g1_i1.p1 TRINITY_DN6285_c0_g1~~TRINITY_DN6285_c0_g1_i1.p1  ORF type:complete len:237 (+),score=25.91 TRINITY_DN6285_c0_g1_i1:309-1019(+)